MVHTRSDGLRYGVGGMGLSFVPAHIHPVRFAERRGRFIGVIDGMASLIPLAVVLVIVFGKPHLLGTAARWETAILLIFVTATDLFGGYAFTIALSRRTFDVAATTAPAST